MTIPTQAEIEQARKELEYLRRFQCSEMIARDVFGSWAVRNLKVLSYILNATADYHASTTFGVEGRCGASTGNFSKKCEKYDEQIEPQVNFSWEQPE